MPQQLTEDTRRDGISWFDDRLDTVACHAGTELDMIRLGRAMSNGDTDWHVRVIGTWFLEFAQEENRFASHHSGFLYRLSKRLGVTLKGATIDDLKPFAAHLGTDLFQAIHFDPTPGGRSQEDLIHICVEISKLASVDDYYGRRATKGEWRGVNWWVRP